MTQPAGGNFTGLRRPKQDQAIDICVLFQRHKVELGRICFSPALIAATALHQCGACAFGPMDSAAAKALDREMGPVSRRHTLATLP